MSITAFPVLARILTERHLLQTPVGNVAIVGKFGGSALVARLSGMAGREASALGILMNTRGLIELVVLNVGLDIGVISPTLFTMMVFMALVTTTMANPLLSLILPESYYDEALSRAA